MTNSMTNSNEANSFLVDKEAANKPRESKGSVEALSVEKQLASLKAQCPVRERCVDPLIKIDGIAYLVLQRPDIEKAAKFFVDYGLLLDRRTEDTILLRGRTTEHHIIVIEKGPQKVARLGLKASAESVEKLAKTFGKQIKTHPEPIGGRYVTLTDPDNLPVEVNCSFTPLDKLEEKLPSGDWNTGQEKTRLNKTIRHEISPVTVEKLGHSLFSVHNFRKTVHWYQENLGLIVSDLQFLPEDPNPIVAFMRCDNGDVPSDHHTLGFGVAPELGHLHSAFEMDTFEEVAIASEWMASRDPKSKYKHGWGIGRHILGSQIFDYWRDSYGDMFEHYADGDLFSAEVNAGYHFFNGHAQHQWGPKMTAEFKGTNRPWATVKSVVSRLPTKDDLSFKKLMKMLKAI